VNSIISLEGNVTNITSLAKEYKVPYYYNSILVKESVIEKVKGAKGYRWIAGKPDNYVGTLINKILNRRRIDLHRLPLQPNILVQPTLKQENQVTIETLKQLTNISIERLDIVSQRLDTAASHRTVLSESSKEHSETIYRLLRKWDEFEEYIYRPWWKRFLGIK